MASRRESRAFNTGQNTLQEFENLRKSFKASNDRLAKKNNELLAQISALNKQLQDSATENFELRGALSVQQRTSGAQLAKLKAFEREKQTMTDLVDEITRASDWTRKNLTSLRRVFDQIDEAEPPSAVPLQGQVRPRQLLPSIVGVSRQPDMSPLREGGSEDEIRSNGVRSNGRIAPLNHKSRNTAILNAISQEQSSYLRSTPSAFESKRPARRQSGLMSSLDPTARVRSSPPPPISTSYDDEVAPFPEAGTNTFEFNPILSPLALGSDGFVSSSREKEKEKPKRKLGMHSAAAFTPISQTSNPRLHDVTNGSLSLSRAIERKTQRIPSTDEERHTPPPAVPTPIIERRAGKTTSIPTLADDMASQNPIAKTSSTGISSILAKKSSLPIPQPFIPLRSSSPDPLTDASVDPEGGRERRVRKSVNYAEPKLNTKMRKPDGWDASSKSRSSLNAAASGSSSSPARPPDLGAVRKRRTTIGSRTPSSGITYRRGTSSPLSDIDTEEPVSPAKSAAFRLIVDNDEYEDGAEADLDLDPLGEGSGGLWKDASRSLQKKPMSSVSKKNRSLGLQFEGVSTTTLASNPIVVQEQQPTNIIRKRKSPSLSGASSTPIQDDDNAGEDLGYDNDLEYVDDGGDFIRGISTRRKSTHRLSGTADRLGGLRER